MAKSFLFITPLTPSRLLTPLRQLLFRQFLSALEAQAYKGWKAVLIGDRQETSGQISYVKIGAESKEIKLAFAREYLTRLERKPDYVIRIDDDDIISPNALAGLAEKDFDCYADRCHAFYDISTGRISSQKRDWMPNTVVHKYEHAMSEAGPDGECLLQSDHSAVWHNY